MCITTYKAKDYYGLVISEIFQCMRCVAQVIRDNLTYLVTVLNLWFNGSEPSSLKYATDGIWALKKYKK